MAASKARQAQVAERRARAIELKASGATNQQIADRLGYTSARAVSTDLGRALKANTEAQHAAADDYRSIELERLEALWRKAWEVLETEVPTVSHGRVVTVEDETGRKATVPDRDHVLRAIETLRKISESRRKLLGLDSAVQVDAGITVRYEIAGVDMEALR